MLTYEQIKRRKQICEIFIEKPQNDRFLRQIVITKEKWIYLIILINLISGLGSQVEPGAKRGQFKKKFIQTAFRNYEGVIIFELLPNGKTVSSNYYCEIMESIYSQPSFIRNLILPKPRYPKEKLQLFLISYSHGAKISDLGIRN